MQYTGDYTGTIHTYCDQFNYTDPIAFSIDPNGNVSLPPYDEGALQGGQIDTAGNLSGLSITVNSLSLGALRIPYSGHDDGSQLVASGTSVNGITSIIDATLVPPASPTVMTPIVTTDNGDGTHTIAGSTDDLVINSVRNDVITGGGVRETFVFTPHFGHDEITDFVSRGQNHDTLDLSATQYHSLAQVLRHSSLADGSATIQLNPYNSITLDGITKADLKAHPHDFTFA